MDRSRHPALSRKVRRCIEAFLTVLEEVGRLTEVLPSETRTPLQDAVADMQRQLQTFGEVVEHALVETGTTVEVYDTLTRLIEQVRARRHDIQQELERTLATSTGDWEARAAVLEAARSQLDKTIQVAVHTLASRSKRRRKSDS